MTNCHQKPASLQLSENVLFKKYSAWTFVKAHTFRFEKMIKPIYMLLIESIYIHLYMYVIADSNRADPNTVD